MGATLSYVCGASDEPLLYKTVGAALEDAAAQWPERIALIVSHQAIRWSYRHLNGAADRLAAGLLYLGLVPRDCIGIWSPNRYEWVLTQFASAKAGLILVNINPAYRLSASVGLLGSRPRRRWSQSARRAQSGTDRLFLVSGGPIWDLFSSAHSENCVALRVMAG
jgi:acyl-CoA synthetase (AMP-forming)/AMP-acid ligase II